MSQEDANDLLAYLNVLGTDAQPGLSDDVIRVNVIGAPDRRAGDIDLRP